MTLSVKKLKWMGAFKRKGRGGGINLLKRQRDSFKEWGKGYTRYEATNQDRSFGLPMPKKKDGAVT